MKHIFYSLILIMCIAPSNIKAQTSVQMCNLGFAFQISTNPNWGYNEPIIVDVTPGSPAEAAGLKINDIILEVNGNGTYLKPFQTIMSWFALDDTKMSISIRNFTTSFKNLTIQKDCRHPNAISEAQLAPVFAFYSLEDVQNRLFVMPVKTSANSDIQFSAYRTFDFAPSDESMRELDERINAIFVRVLSEMGLQRDSKDPDFIVQTYYSYENNPMFKMNSPTYGSYQPVWRFDTRNKRMVKVPVYSPSEAVRVDDIMYNLEFGYRFFDRKQVQPGESALIWESEIKERISGYYGLLDYLELNLPLMLLKFPYSGSGSSATYSVRHLKYHYTGIGYDMNDLKTVISVAPGSPAALAGIIPGDVIEKIQNQHFTHSDSHSLTEGYRRFIGETMGFRDQSTRYTDSNGFKDCMFWNISQYNNVSKAISDTRRYRAVFSYLFGFNQYINWATPGKLQIEVSRGIEKLQFDVIPRIETSTHILVE